MKGKNRVQKEGEPNEKAELSADLAAKRVRSYGEEERLSCGSKGCFVGSWSVCGSWGCRREQRD